VSEFDEISSNYEKILDHGISLSGEKSDYFAFNRVDHIAKLDTQFRGKSEKILDYGCGTGGSTKFLLDAFNPKTLFVTDTSEKSLRILKNKYLLPQIQIIPVDSNVTKLNCDVCYCNGVFHHIPLSERNKAVKFVFDSLKNGGRFYFWENNPWNPATHWVMSRINFDRDAIKVFPNQAVKLLQNVGFEIKLINYMFIFPRFLKMLRPIEKLILMLPLGCQYLVVAQKP
jgi:SAM-dependent methyltransferase